MLQSTANNNIPRFATFLLVITILHGSSFTLTLAFRGPLANETLVQLVTITWLALYGFAALGLFAAYGLNWATWLVRYRLPLTCVLAGTAFSAAWSVDTSLTIERSIHLIGSSLIALYIGFTLPLTRLLKTSALTLGIIMLASALVAILLPEMGLVNYEGTLVWTGVLASKNTLGFWSAITILLLVSLCFWQTSNKLRMVYMILAAVSLLCLFRSHSATSLLSLLTAAMIMIYLHVAFRLSLSIVAMMVLGALVAVLVGMAFYFIDTAELIGRSGDLTGRGEVWSQTLQLILERPFTGFGYGTIWFPTDTSLYIQESLTDFSWTVYHAHNGLLQIASEIGLPLTGLALFMILQQLVELIYCQYQRQQPGVLFVLGFVVALLVSNYSEARLLVNRELYWIFFIALPISMLQQVVIVADTTSNRNLSGALATGKTLKLRVAREKLAQKRSIKERLRKQRPVKIINEHEEPGLETIENLQTTTYSQSKVQPAHPTKQ